MIDIINAYVASGYHCVLITGRLVQRSTPLHASVKIERIIKYDRKTTLRRLLTWTLGFLQILIKIVFKFRKDILFIVSNPPVALFLPILVKNRYQLLIFDVYPDALSELGYLSHKSFIIKLWRKANRKVFERADSIFTITESMKEVLQVYSGGKMIKVVQVWTDNLFFKPIDPDKNSFIKKHNLSGKFIVLYSGNIGLSGDVEVLTDIAERINRDDIIFVIIGDGAKKQMISEKKEKLRLKNLILMPWQPVSELPFSLSAASLAVISIGKKASSLAIPSKLFNFLSVGAPLLCMTSKGSEVDRLVNRYECGKSFEPDDISGMVNFILELADNEILNKVFSQNSLKASESFDISNVNLMLEATHNI
jgi:glycosyltransferase involved in cell wall biosynthesis